MPIIIYFSRQKYLVNVTSTVKLVWEVNSFKDNIDIFRYTYMNHISSIHGDLNIMVISSQVAILPNLPHFTTNSSYLIKPFLFNNSPFPFYNTVSVIIIKILFSWFNLPCALLVWNVQYVYVPVFTFVCFQASALWLTTGSSNQQCGMAVTFPFP